MDFIREEFLEKRRWRWTNELLKLGSQCMLNRFSSDECDAIATISFLAIFAWAIIGGLGVATTAIEFSFVALVVAFVVFFTVMVGILGTLIVSVVNTKKPSP